MLYNEIIIDNNSEDFIQRVMKENLWDRNYTLRVIEEYKKFLWLSTKTKVSPSHQIDQVWHAHILYTQDYQLQSWYLNKGMYIHHNPTSSKDKAIQGIKPYIDTKSAYEEYFGTPPSDIWTDFKPSHYAYLNLSELWVIPFGDWKALVTILFKYIKFKINGIF